MENDGSVYQVQVTGLTSGNYDLVFVITGQEAKVNGDFIKVKCCDTFLYGSDDVGFGNFKRTLNRSVQVMSPDRPGPQTDDSSSGIGRNFTKMSSKTGRHYRNRKIFDG